jgi:hypothetical protein
MSGIGKGIGLMVALAAAAGAGYWFGGRQAGGGHEQAATAAADPAQAGRKILYYRNPMGLPDTSPTPKKDSMGMDYIPVYEGEDEDAAARVKISTAKVQRLGVRSEAAQRRVLDAVVRATGRVEVDERRLFTITPKFEGYVEKLFVNATGQYVARGAPLFEAYSPELLATQREYAIAAQGLAQVKGADSATVDGMKRLADSALERLRNWDVTDEQIAQLAAGGAPVRALTFRAPASGHVIERRATQGMRFMPGEMLYQIADLSSVWVIADVFEQDIGRVRVGQPRIGTARGLSRRGLRRPRQLHLSDAACRDAQRAGAHRAGQPGRPHQARDVRPGRAAGAGAAVLAVPNSALIDSGTRRIVLIDQGEGRFEPREVKLGARGDDSSPSPKGSRKASGRGRRRQLPDRRGEQPQGRARRHGRRHRHRRQEAGHAQRTGTLDRRRREDRHAADHARTESRAQLAADDDGVRAGQSFADREDQAGAPIQLRVRRAQARRVGHHQDRGALRCWRI